MKKGFKNILRKLFWGGFRHLLSDRKYAQIRYWLELDEWPDIEKPKKFSEKIQHIKLYDRTLNRKKVANRLAVRRFVADRIGRTHLVPLIDSFDNLSRRAWRNLPAQFILKANHGCGMHQIVFDKARENFKKIQQEMRQWQSTNYYAFGREWAYKNIPRTIVAEKLLLNAYGNIPMDYKFFCFNGNVKLIQVDYNRFGEHKRNLFDPNYKRIDGTLLYPPSPEQSQKPEHFNQAKKIAESLSCEFNFIRVDLYLMEEKVYFGELTNYPGNGFQPFKPESLECKMGSFLTL